MACFECAVLQMQRYTAIRAVPEEIPNPKFVEAVRAGKPTQFKQKVPVFHRTTRELVVGRKVTYTAIAPTIPNKDFDRQVDMAMRLPDRCGACAKEQDRALKDKLLKAQTVGEAVLKMAKAQQRRVRAGLVDPESPSAKPVSVVLPYGK